MGSIFSGPPKPRGPSPAEIAAQKQREEDLKKQREDAETETARLKKLDEQEKDALNRRKRGRISLISGSELGEQEKLG